MMIGATSLDTIIQISKWILNTLFHQCVAVIFIYAIWIAIEKYSNTLSWHVILCSLGVSLSINFSYSSFNFYL